MLHSVTPPQIFSGSLQETYTLVSLIPSMYGGGSLSTYSYFPASFQTFIHYIFPFGFVFCSRRPFFSPYFKPSFVACPLHDLVIVASSCRVRPRLEIETHRQYCARNIKDKISAQPSTHSRPFCWIPMAAIRYDINELLRQEAIFSDTIGHHDVSPDIPHWVLKKSYGCTFGYVPHLVTVLWDVEPALLLSDWGA